MLDDEDGDAALANAAHDVDHLLDLGRIEAGEHLVEQQEMRTRAERARKLESLLAGRGELAGRHVDLGSEADLGRDLTRRRTSLFERKVLAPEAGPDGAIVEHAQAGERLHDLMRAGQP